MIIQGSNEPIVIEFKDQPYVVSVLAALFDERENELKSWSFAAEDIVDNMILAELTEEETLHFPVGIARFEFKWIDRDGNVWNSGRIGIRVSDRSDERVFGESTGTSTDGETVITHKHYIVKTARSKIINAETGAVVYHGKSPYYDEEAHTWMEWDDDKEMYVKSEFERDFTEEEIEKLKRAIVDPTLTKEGMAADSKVVGDKFSALPKEISNSDINDIWNSIFGG